MNTFPDPMPMPNVRTATKEELLTFCTRSSRADVITLCIANDPNGCWADEDFEVEFGYVQSTDELRIAAKEMFDRD